MKRFTRTIFGCLFTAGLLTAAPGCDHRKQALRSGLTTDNEPPADPVKDDPTFQRPPDLKGFFKQNRYAGTLSSEAQEIETNLGILR